MVNDPITGVNTDHRNHVRVCTCVESREVRADHGVSLETYFNSGVDLTNLELSAARGGITLVPGRNGSPQAADSDRDSHLAPRDDTVKKCETATSPLEQSVTVAWLNIFRHNPDIHHVESGCFSAAVHFPVATVYLSRNHISPLILSPPVTIFAAKLWRPLGPQGWKSFVVSLWSPGTRARIH